MSKVLVRGLVLDDRIMWQERNWPLMCRTDLKATFTVK